MWSNICFQEVVDNYGAVIKLLVGGDKLKVDQAHLETVIPAIGRWTGLTEVRYIV